MKATLYVLLTIVGAAAAVLSFDGLRGLAELCGFGGLSWLLPVVIDLGAVAGTVAWLGGDRTQVTRLGRNQALILLGVSVGFNVLFHALDAYGLGPSWWLVSSVAAVSPAVLAAVGHLTYTLVTAGTVSDLDQRPGVSESTPEPLNAPAEGKVQVELTTEPMGPPAGDEPWPFAAAVAWAAREGAGSKRIQSHTGLSEYKAKQAARDAKTQKQLRVAR